VGGGVKSVACGTAHTAAMTVSGDVYSWGKHDDGRLGFEATADQTTPKLVESLCGRDIKQIVCGVYNTAALSCGVCATTLQFDNNDSDEDDR
jgi:alpha-tubulin suppressor-like RCC1 family protein